MSASTPSEPSADYRVLTQGKDFYMGVLAALVTVSIWSGWLISVRLSASGQLTSFDLAVMRYLVPALVLLPFVWRHREKIRNTRFRYLLGMLVGAGVPFFYLSSTGLQYAPAAHAGLLIPGTFPLFVTAMAVFIYKQPLHPARFWGLSWVALGVAVLMSHSLYQGDLQVLKGDLLLLGASFCWALFTVSLRVAGLPPLAAAGLLCCLSCGVLAFLALMGWYETGITTASSQEIATQLVTQALLAGLLAGFSYGFAINRIGAENTSAIGALTPVLTGLAAIPLLGESLSLAALLGMLLIGLGAYRASRIRDA